VATSSFVAWVPPEEVAPQLPCGASTGPDPNADSVLVVSAGAEAGVRSE